MSATITSNPIPETNAPDAEADTSDDKSAPDTATAHTAPTYTAPTAPSYTKEIDPRNTPEWLSMFFSYSTPDAVKIRFFKRVAEFEDIEWRDAAQVLLAGYSDEAIADAMTAPVSTIAQPTLPKTRRKKASRS